jgi:LacI family transcriptional regulator
MPTIREVAKAAGVSTATVSNVLHGRSARVSAETRDKVFSAVRTLKYRPTPFEQDQGAILTHNIGLMITDLTTDGMAGFDYQRKTLDGVLGAAALKGWSVTIFVERMWYDVGLAVRRSYDGRCDGLISVSPQPGNEVVEALQERGTPLVLVGSTPWLPDISSVDIDNFAVGETAARHLFQLGHRRLAYYGDGWESVSGHERRQSFFATARTLGVPESDLHWIQRVDEDGETVGRRAWADILSEDPRPTGIFCWNDGFARELLGAAPAAGVRIPDDASVIGVDDGAGSDTCVPPLTTFRNPVEILGKRAANMLIDRLTTGRDVAENVRYVPDFVVRASTGPASA